MGAPLDVLAEWGVTDVARVAVPSTGTQNETWIIERRHGPTVVFRRHRRTDLAEVMFEHAVIRHAAAGGIPVAPPIPTASGQSAVEAGGRIYSVYALAPGELVATNLLSSRHAFAMGVTLAQLHHALVDMPAAAAPSRDRLGPVEWSLKSIDDLRLVLIEKHGRDSPGVQSLDARRSWLETAARSPEMWRDPPDEPQLIHGDYQHTNLFFDNDAISAVIDWDKARSASPAVEVVRTMHHALSLRSDLCQAMLDGYRSARTLPTETLNDAARWFGVQQAASLWTLEQQYLHGRTLALFGLNEQHGFVPVSSRWAELHLQ